MTTSPRRDHRTASKQPTHVHDHNLAIQLKTLQVQIDALGGEYHVVTLAVSDAYDDLLSIYRKNKNKEISKKQKASIQASIKAFFKK